MSSLRRPPSRFGVIPRAAFFVLAILLALGLFFGLLAGAIALRVAYEKRADKDWKPPVEDPKEVARREALAKGVPLAALTPETRPTLVVAREPQQIGMWASDATLVGDGASISGKRDKLITDWRGEDTAATWSVDPAAGEYFVDITYACRKEEGGDFIVTVGNQALKGKAVPTPGQVREKKATNYSTIRVGQVKLVEGPITVEVRPDGKPAGASLMSLLRVDLIPPGAPGANAAVTLAQAMEVEGDDDAGGKADKRNAEERAEAIERHKRAASRAAAAQEEMIQWKQMAAAVNEFDKQARKVEEKMREARRKELKELLERKKQERQEAARKEKEEGKPPHGVMSLAVVDAADGHILDRLKEGATINLAALPKDRITIRAMIWDEDDDAIGSVRFGYDGKESFLVDNRAPFTANGGGEGDRPIRPMTLHPGVHTMAATTFAGPNATGASGKTYRISFTVVDDANQIDAGGMVVGFTLIDTDKNKPIGPLSEGAELDLSGKHVTIRADVAGKVSSLRFDLYGGPAKFYKHAEGAAPFTLNGDDQGKTYVPYDLKPGTYRISAFPYSESDLKGKAGKTLSVKFEVEP